MIRSLCVAFWLVICFQASAFGNCEGLLPADVPFCEVLFAVKDSSSQNLGHTCDRFLNSSHHLCLSLVKLVQGESCSEGEKVPLCSEMREGFYHSPCNYPSEEQLQACRFGEHIAWNYQSIETRHMRNRYRKYAEFEANKLNLQFGEKTEILKTLAIEISLWRDLVKDSLETDYLQFDFSVLFKNLAALIHPLDYREHLTETQFEWQIPANAPPLQSVTIVRTNQTLFAVFNRITIGQGTTKTYHLAADLKTGSLLAAALVPNTEEIWREKELLSQFSGNTGFVKLKYFPQKTGKQILFFQELYNFNLYTFYRNSVSKESYDGLTWSQLLLKLMLEVSEGLQNLHARQIAHRDLKPANILVRIDTTGGPPHAALCDLELASPIHSKIPTLIGSPAYLSPQLAGVHGDKDQILIQNQSLKNDIWSLGLSFQEALQRRMVITDSPNRLLDRIASIDHLEKVPAVFNRLTPEGAILSRLLEPHPESRYSTFELVTRLKSENFVPRFTFSTVAAQSPKRKHRDAHANPRKHLAAPAQNPIN